MCIEKPECRKLAIDETRLSEMRLFFESSAKSFSQKRFSTRLASRYGM